MRNGISRISVFLLLGLTSLLIAACTTISTSGDYTLESGQTLRGNLVITSGNAALKEGSRVTGSVLMTSGNLAVDGEVDGDVVMTSGNVSLGPKAVIRGDIRSTSGDIRQADGARIEGSITTDQSTFTIGGRFFTSLFAIFCCLPLLLVGGLLLIILLFSRGRSSRAAPPPPVAVKPAFSGTGQTPTDKLQQLKDMLDQGLITQEEYDAKKAEILDTI